MSTELKPFDLEKALANPDLVVTRDGEKVLDLRKFSVETDYPLVGVVAGKTQEWKLNGSYDMRGYETECDLDLFLLSEKKIYWLNLYNNDGKCITCGPLYEDNEKAIRIGKTYPGYVKTMSLEIEL